MDDSQLLCQEIPICVKKKKKKNLWPWDHCAVHPSVFVYNFKRTLKLALTDLFGALGLCKQAINAQQIIMIILRVDIAQCSKLQSAAYTSAFLFMKNITRP